MPGYQGWGATPAPGYGYGTPTGGPVPYGGWPASAAQWGPGYPAPGYPPYGTRRLTFMMTVFFGPFFRALKMYYNYSSSSAFRRSSTTLPELELERSAATARRRTSASGTYASNERGSSTATTCCSSSCRWVYVSVECVLKGERVFLDLCNI